MSLPMRLIPLFLFALLSVDAFPIPNVQQTVLNGDIAAHDGHITCPNSGIEPVVADVDQVFNGGSRTPWRWVVALTEQTNICPPPIRTGLRCEMANIAQYRVYEDGTKVSQVDKFFRTGLPQYDPSRKYCTYSFTTADSVASVRVSCDPKAARLTLKPNAYFGMGRRMGTFQYRFYGSYAGVCPPSPIAPRPHDVYLFVDGIHFKIGIHEQKGPWQVYEYAAGGASGYSSSGQIYSSTDSPVKVTKLSHVKPSGKHFFLGRTGRSLQSATDFALAGGFDGSEYSLNSNNCRHFTEDFAAFLGVKDTYLLFSRGYLFSSKTDSSALTLLDTVADKLAVAQQKGHDVVSSVIDTIKAKMDQYDANLFTNREAFLTFLGDLNRKAIFSESDL